MENLITYLREYGKYDFRQRPFCPADSLVLAELSYLKYEVCMSTPAIWKKIFESLHEKLFLKHMSMKQIAHLKGEDFQALFRGVVDVESNRTLFLEVAFSKRFGGMQICLYENLVDPENETQFAAMIFLLEGWLPFVTFRGTDETLVGWKEDFNMAFMSPVPAQKHAAEYLKKAALFLKRYPGFLLGGHSKGGNLAVYAATHAGESVQSHIVRIYNLDGPGFRENIYEASDYCRIADRVTKIIPQSSVIGMLMENQNHYKVIKSSQKGILQHDPFSWIIHKGDFLYLEELDAGARIMGKTLYEWMDEMSPEEKERLVTLLFQLLSNEKLTPFALFSEDWKDMAKKILDAMGEVDKETQRFIWEVSLQLIRIGTRNMVTMTVNQEKGAGEFSKYLPKRN